MADIIANDQTLLNVEKTLKQATFIRPQDREDDSQFLRGLTKALSRPSQDRFIVARIRHLVCAMSIHQTSGLCLFAELAELRQAPAITCDVLCICVLFFFNKLF